MMLGYTGKSWDNDSDNEKQPASDDKFFAELTTCGECAPAIWGCAPLTLVFDTTSSRWSDAYVLTVKLTLSRLQQH